MSSTSHAAPARSAELLARADELLTHAEQLHAHVVALVDRAPPLTPAQRDQLVALLRPLDQRRDHDAA